MKIAAIGDIHANNWKDYATTINVEWDDDSGRYTMVDESDITIHETLTLNSRLFNILSGLSDLRDYCVNHHIKLCLCLGDIFHTRGAVDTTVFNTVYRIFESFYQAGIEVIMIAGNHDQATSMIYSENSLYPFGMINQVVSQPTLIPYSDGSDVINFVCLPYSKDKEMILSNLKEMIKQTEGDKKNGIPRVLLAHLGLSGGLVGSGNYVMSDEYNLMELSATKFKYCIFGHYHKPQVLEYNSIYTGSPLQNTFNDEGDEHGFWIIDTSKRWDMQLVPLLYPKFITVNKNNVSDLSTDDLAYSYLRVQASAKDAEKIMDTLNDASGDLVLDKPLSDIIRLEVEKDYDTEGRSDISITMELPEIIKTYTKENNTTALSDEILLKKGMEILAKIQEV